MPTCSSALLEADASIQESFLFPAISAELMQTFEQCPEKLKRNFPANRVSVCKVCQPSHVGGEQELAFSARCPCLLFAVCLENIGWHTNKYQGAVAWAILAMSKSCLALSLQDQPRESSDGCSYGLGAKQIFDMLRTPMQLRPGW